REVTVAEVAAQIAEQFPFIAAHEGPKRLASPLSKQGEELLVGTVGIVRACHGISTSGYAGSASRVRELASRRPRWDLERLANFLLPALLLGGLGLLGGLLGLGRWFFFGAEDGFVSLGEMLRFSQANADDAHVELLNPGESLVLYQSKRSIRLCHWES